MNTRSSHSRQGAALPLALYLMVIFGLIMAGILMVSMRGYQAMSARGAYEQSLYAAEAGLNVMLGEIAVYLESGGTMPTHVTGSLGEGLGSYDVQIVETYLNPGGAVGAKINNGNGNSGNGNGGTTEPSSTTTNRWFWIRATGQLGGASRVVNVKLVDTPWDNPWNHVYYTDSAFAALHPESGTPGKGNYRPAYASYSGSNDVMPCSATDPHGPSFGDWMPEPLWDEIRTEAFEQQSSNINNIEYTTASTHSTNAVNDTHVYWPASLGNTPPADADFSDPAFTVAFGEGGADPEVYDGIYYVHGNVRIGAHTSVTGTIVATGDIRGSGNAQRIVVTAQPYQEYNPDDPDPYRRPPALISGGDITLSSNDMTFLGAVYAADFVDLHSASIFGSIVTPEAYFRGLGDGRGAKDYPYDLQYGFSEPIGWYNSKNGLHHPIYRDYINADTEYDEGVFYFPGRYKMPYFTQSPDDDTSLHYEIGTYWEE